MPAWSEEEKAAIISQYEAAEPTAANSMDIVNQITDELKENGKADATPNGVRMILTKGGVYIKKEGGAKATPSKTAAAGSGDKAPRVSKEAAHADLKAAIEAAGGDVDDEIIGKLTGKAAQYFTKVLSASGTLD